MARKSKREESCDFDFDRIEVWGPELKRLFKDALPRRLKRIFEAEPPDDLEHAREILLAHMTIERSEVIARLRKWIEGKRVAVYYGARGEVRSELSLSHAPFEQYFDAHVPGGDAKRQIIRVELDGAEVLGGQTAVLDGLPGVIREVLDAWSYWLADAEFAPANEALFVPIRAG